MPKKCFKATVTARLHSVSCPGVILKDKSEVYLRISLLGHHRRTFSVPAIFPLYFGQTFRFERCFFDAVDLTTLSYALEDEMVLVELVQFDIHMPGGAVLAEYESNAQEFLYPYPSLSPSYGSQDREVLMMRTMHFDGISPKLEFSTETTIKEVSEFSHADRLDLENVENDLSRNSKRYRLPRKDLLNFPKQRGRSRSKKYADVSPTRRGRSYDKKSAGKQLRTRSVSPSKLGERPPFVVRKVPEEILTGYPYFTGSDEEEGVKCDHNLKRKKKSARKSSDSRHRSAINNLYKGIIGEDYYKNSADEHNQVKVIREPSDRFIDLNSPLYSDEEYRNLPSSLPGLSAVATEKIERKIRDIDRRLATRTSLPERYVDHSEPLDYVPGYYPSSYWRIRDKVDRAVAEAQTRRHLYEDMANASLDASDLYDPYGSSRSYVSEFSNPFRRRMFDESLDRVYNRLYRKMRRHYNCY